MQVIRSITIRRPSNMHAHVRQDELMVEVVPHLAKHFAYITCMPNTDPPILTGPDAVKYRGQILELAQPFLRANPEFNPLKVIKITHQTTPQMIYEAHSCGVRLAKLYPAGRGAQQATTNSADGVNPQDHHLIYPVLDVMEELGWILLVHGEDPMEEPRKREAAFLPHMVRLIDQFDSLKMVLEHVSSANGVWFVEQTPATVSATITAHHMYLSHDDWYGGHQESHYNCKPPLKDWADQAAVVAAATSGSPKFFAGFDGAAHMRNTKEACQCTAGAWTDPLVLPLTAHVFEQAGALDKLEGFLSVYGPEFYGLPLPEGTITLQKRDVPFKPDMPGLDVVPMPLKPDPERPGKRERIYWHVAD